MNLFDKDILLTDIGNSRFAGMVSNNWSVNGNPNGGYLMAMITDAMLRKSDKKSTPLVTANYLSRCVPGEVEIRISEITRSRQFTRFEARVSQQGEEKIRALGTFASDNTSCNVERYETKPPELAPVEECVQIPPMPKYSLFQNLDLRLDPGCAGWMFGKLIDPAVMATQGMNAWVPTIELSVNIRNLPQTDRLRCSLRTRFITCGLLEADGEVWDEKGNLAAISRQIAQFKTG
ncbi:MAG: thioesterase family protein [Deltaproteobacteria bacterium HGW-Deltaproteobacteria-1]|nr:MAG: thioesterase family protein [Deltaproteobacteria bacterium HGW-Deltaproteobacteria-1]